MLDSDRVVRRVGASKAVGALMRPSEDDAGECEKEASQAEKGESGPSKGRDSLLWRLAACGQRTRLIHGGTVVQWMFNTVEDATGEAIRAGLRAEPLDRSRSIVFGSVMAWMTNLASTKPSDVWMREVERAKRLWSDDEAFGALEVPTKWPGVEQRGLWASSNQTLQLTSSARDRTLSEPPHAPCRGQLATERQTLCPLGVLSLLVLVA